MGRRVRRVVHWISRIAVLRGARRLRSRPRAPRRRSGSRARPGRAAAARSPSRAASSPRSTARSPTDEITSNRARTGSPTRAQRPPGNFEARRSTARPGQPLPVIKTSATWGSRSPAEAKLSNVDVEDSSSFTDTVGIDVNEVPPADDPRRVRDLARHGLRRPWACYPDGELLDSVCWSTGTDGSAMAPPGRRPCTRPTCVLINDTMIASGTGGDALEVGQGGRHG